MNKKIVISSVIIFIILSFFFLYSYNPSLPSLAKARDRVNCLPYKSGIEQYINDTDDVNLSKLLNGDELTFENVIIKLQDTKRIDSEEKYIYSPIEEDVRYPFQYKKVGWKVEISTISKKVKVEASEAKSQIIFLKN